MATVLLLELDDEDEASNTLDKRMPDDAVENTLI